MGVEVGARPRSERHDNDVDAVGLAEQRLHPRLADEVFVAAGAQGVCGDAVDFHLVGAARCTASSGRNTVSPYL